MFIPNLLSQYDLMGPSHLIRRPLRIILSHNSSQIPCAIALNSASALDLTTIGCFLLLQVTKFPPRKVQ